jgi:hypothetical protein
MSTVKGREVEGVMLRSITVTEVSDEGTEIRHGNNNSVDYKQRQTRPQKWTEQYQSPS